MTLFNRPLVRVLAIAVCSLALLVAGCGKKIR